MLVGWLASVAFVACTSFSSSPTDDGGGNDAGIEGSAVDGPGGADADAMQGPVCPASDKSCDPENCGSAGHSCLGGACVTGKCQPAIMATFMATLAYGPVVDSARVVISTPTSSGTGRARWCPKAGCATGMLGVDLPTLPTGPNSILSDGTNVFVSTFGGMGAGVFRIDQGGSATPITPTDGTFQYADDLSLSGSDVVFVTNYQTSGIGIYRVPSNGSAAATEIVPILSTDRWAHTVSAAGSLFVADYELIATCAGVTCANLAVYAAPAVAHLDITGLVTDGAALFWTSDKQQLLTCAVGPSCANPSIVVGAQAFEGSIPIALSIQGADLYVTTAAGKIFTCAAAMCGPTFKPVVADEVVEGAAAADADAVYWLGRARIDAGAGPQGYRLMRLAK
jgi:hypothetical protein